MPQTTNASAREGAAGSSRPGLCPACAAPDLEPCGDSEDYLACPTCGTLRSLSEEGEYQAGYYFHDASADRSARRRAQLQVAHLADLLPFLAGLPAALGPEVRILEVGCAKGFLVENLTSLGVDAHGVDVSEPAITAAAERGLGDRCHVSDARELAERNQPFDVVCAFELLEHFDDPRAFLESVTGALRPGGWLIGTTPNADSHWRRTLGNGWHGYGIPQFHRILLGAEGFRSLAARAGLEAGTSFTRTERSSDWLLLRNRATVAASRLGSRNRVLRAGLASLLAVPQLAAERASNRVGGPRGDTLVFAARRPPVA